jgi:ectoine hydroxylase-related dioxygenase (phytanoyl-CoA dioxygenase family)
VLTGEQLNEFEKNGFCRLPGLIPRPVLERLRRFFDPMLIADRVPGKAIAESPQGRVVTNVDQLLAWGDPAVLDLLALPETMKVASAICGDNLFTVQEFAVIKHRGDATPVLWHQDMVNGRSAPCLSMGIYLDDADAGEGALRFIPGSHLRSEPICELARMPAVEVPAEAGDVIIHDMMTAHSSEPMDGNGLRRVIYLVFLSSELALGEDIYPREFVDNRRRLLFAARRYRRETFPSAGCFKPRQREPNSRDRKRPLHEILADVHNTATRLRPSNYCFDRIPAKLD